MILSCSLHKYHTSDFPKILQHPSIV